MDFRSILIPLALLTLTASVVAKEAASGGEVTKRVYVVTGANASDMPFWIGLGRANEKLEEAITALVEAGELSEDGAAKLREILEKARPRHDKQWRTWRQGKGMGKALSVEVDDEGNVAVEGKGYTDEELDRIREQVEAGIGSDDVVIIDGDDHEIIIDLQDGQAHKYKFMFRDGDGAMRMFEGRGEGWGGWEDWLDPERLKQLGELHPRLSRQRWMRNWPEDSGRFHNWFEKREFSPHPFALEEGWEGSFDELMEEIEEMVYEFLEEHAAEEEE